MIGTGLNILVIAMLVFLIAKYAMAGQPGRAVLPALVLKLLAGILMGVVFKQWYGGGDTFSYYDEGLRLSGYFRQQPGFDFRVFYDTGGIQELLGQLHYREQPRALFFSKIIAFVHLLTRADYWIMSVYFSMFSFMGALVLVEQLVRKFRGIKLPAVVAFLYLPSVLFWSSGILKESVAVPALYFMVAFALRGKRGKGLVPWAWVAGFLLSGYLLWNLRYFYLGAALPLLLAAVAAGRAHGLDRMPRSKRIMPGLVYFLILTVSFYFMSRMHYNLRQEHIAEVLYENYQMFNRRSEPGAGVVFEDLRPDPLSFAMHAPAAIFSGLFRPNIWDIRNGRQLPQVLENFLLLVLSLLYIYGITRKRPHAGFWGLSAILYVAIMSALLVFASPNFGSLMRYRTGYLSFYVLLILYQNPVVDLMIKRFFRKTDH